MQRAKRSDRLNKSTSAQTSNNNNTAATTAKSKSNHVHSHSQPASLSPSLHTHRHTLSVSFLSFCCSLCPRCAAGCCSCAAAVAAAKHSMHINDFNQWRWRRQTERYIHSHTHISAERINNNNKVQCVFRMVFATDNSHFNFSCSSSFCFISNAYALLLLLSHIPFILWQPFAKLRLIVLHIDN